MERYTDLHVPALAIYAIPVDFRVTVKPGSTQAESIAAAEAASSNQADAFEKGVVSARVIRIAHASHYIFLSNEAEVLREMETFIDGLK